MLRFETCPAGESGSRVSAEMSFEFVLNPLKNAEQYEKFPPRSTDEEQRLVLFEDCLINVPTGTGPGPPAPPVRVGPDGVATKDAFANSELCVTRVDRG